MNQQEEWRPIKGFEGFYEINQFGVIRTVERIVYSLNSSHKRIVRARVRKNSINCYGYYYVRLRNKTGQHNILVHRALMEAFVPNPENKPCIDHINTIKTDNRLENLRWVNHSENTQNPLTLRHIKESCATPECIAKQLNTKKIKKSKNYNPREVYQYTLDGRFVARYNSLMDAARCCATKARQIVGNILIAVDKPNRSAYGYKWYSTPLND